MEINLNTIEIEQKQKAVLVCMQYPEMNKGEAAVHLEELKSLVDTMGAETVETLIVPLKKEVQSFL